VTTACEFFPECPPGAAGISRSPAGENFLRLRAGTLGDGGARLSRRAVRVKAGANVLFTVMPSAAVIHCKGACQAGDGGANRITKAEVASTGCFDRQKKVIVIRRPLLYSACIARAELPLAKFTVLIRSWSNGRARQSFRLGVS